MSFDQDDSSEYYYEEGVFERGIPRFLKPTINIKSLPSITLTLIQPSLRLPRWMRKVG
jgi:hypothetical protein